MLSLKQIEELDEKVDEDRKILAECFFEVGPVKREADSVEIMKIRTVLLEKLSRSKGECPEVPILK